MLRGESSGGRGAADSQLPDDGEGGGLDPLPDSRRVYPKALSIVNRSGAGPDAEATVRIESILDGKVVEFTESIQTAGEPLVPLPEPDDGSVTFDFAPETISVMGKELKGFSVKVARDGDWLQTWYVSPELPVYGLAGCRTDDGSGDFQLLDYHKN